MITLFRCVDQHNEQKYLIETWMLSLRYEEEIEIVKNEMTAFLRSTRKKIVIFRERKNNSNWKL